MWPISTWNKYAISRLIQRLKYQYDNALCLFYEKISKRMIAPRVSKGIRKISHILLVGMYIGKTSLEKS